VGRGEEGRSTYYVKGNGVIRSDKNGKQRKTREKYFH
jgi:hypothetical protein